MERTESAREGQTQTSSRNDLVLASVFTALGLAAIVIGRGGFGVIIAGSVGSVGASVAAVGLAAADRRLSYRDKAQVGVCIVLMMLVVGVAIGDMAFILAGYPLLALGLAGLLPALRRSIHTAPSAPPHRPVETSRRAAEVHAL